MRILVEPNAHHLLNVGDVAMLEIAVERLRSLWPNASVDVITDHPDRLARVCPGALPVPAQGRRLWFRDCYLGETLHRHLPPPVSRHLLDAERVARRRRPATAEAAIRLTAKLRGEPLAPLDLFLQAVQDADLVVVSGAGALTDAFAPLAISVLDLLQMARKRGTTTAFLGQGLGPLTDPYALGRARDVLPNVDLITLREGRSGEPFLASLGVPADRVLTTGDDAIELAYRSRRNSALQPGVGVSVRAARYSAVGDGVLDRLRPILARAADRHCASLIAIPISRVPNEADGAAIGRLLGADATRAGVDDLETPAQVFERIHACRVVVAGSYHAAVFALAQGVPAVALARSPYYVEKFLGLRQQFDGHLQVVSLDDPLLAERLAGAIDTAWTKADELRPHLIAAAHRQIERAQTAYRRLPELVGAREPRERSSPRRRRAPPVPAQTPGAHAFNLHRQNDRAWEERAEAAVQLILRHTGELSSTEDSRPLRVADFGCGNERLRRILELRFPGPQSYQGYDLKPQTTTALALDVVRDFPATDFDVVCCLGLLEYIDDLQWFLRRLSSRFGVAVLSYSPADAPTPHSVRERAARGWRTHFTRAAMEEEFVQSGFVPRDFVSANGGRTGVWLVVSATRRG